MGVIKKLFKKGKEQWDKWKTYIKMMDLNG